jgi:hypothetical protein
LGIVSKITTVLGYFFPRLRLFTHFNKKWVRLHFGRFCSRTHLVILSLSHAPSVLLQVLDLGFNLIRTLPEQAATRWPLCRRRPSRTWTRASEASGNFPGKSIKDTAIRSAWPSHFLAHLGPR